MPAALPFEPVRSKHEAASRLRIGTARRFQVRARPISESRMNRGRGACRSESVLAKFFKRPGCARRTASPRWSQFEQIVLSGDETSLTDKAINRGLILSQWHQCGDRPPPFRDPQFVSGCNTPEINTEVLTKFPYPYAVRIFVHVAQCSTSKFPLFVSGLCCLTRTP